MNYTIHNNLKMTKEKYIPLSWYLKDLHHTRAQTFHCERIFFKIAEIAEFVQISQYLWIIFFLQINHWQLTKTPCFPFLRIGKQTLTLCGKRRSFGKIIPQERLSNPMIHYEIEIKCISNKQKVKYCQHLHAIIDYLDHINSALTDFMNLVFVKKQTEDLMHK